LSARACLAVTAIVVAVGLAACGGDDGDEPAAQDIPQDAVAVVGDAQIPKPALQRQIAALRRAQAGAAEQRKRPETAPPKEQIERQALSSLVLAAALEQEAAERGIEVSAAEVRERWRTAVADQFQTKRALRRFLRGQTQRDVLEQLRLQVLTERIQAQISEQAGDGKQGAAAVKEFERSFQERWQQRTACRDGGASNLCSESE
jgi:hypothetical protein